MTRESTGQPVQRTLIVTLGPLASAVQNQLVPALGEHSALSQAIALLDVDLEEAGCSSAIQSKLARISRRGGRAELAAAGYHLDRLQELALLLVVDLGDPAAVARARALSAEVSEMAQEGWGLDTQATLIALAESWAGEPAREGLRVLLNIALESGAAIIPINRINEQGFELDSAESLVAALAVIVEALVATPLRDVAHWSRDGSKAGPTGASLTTVGLARWVWEPEAAHAYVAGAWRNRVIERWLATANGDETSPTMRADAWFGAHGFLPHALTALLERSVVAYDVPAWPTPYPWEAVAAVGRLRELSAVINEGRAGAVELILDEWADWASEQEALLRNELAIQLNQEPIAGFDHASRFLKGLADTVFDAGGVVAHWHDQLEETAQLVAGQSRALLAELDAILDRWPAGEPAAWLSMLVRPWRWPGLAWEYWTLQHLARELEGLTVQQAAIERQQVIVATAIVLYERLQVAIDRTVEHMEEAAEMLSAARADIHLARPDAGRMDRLIRQESPELEATEAAAELGGLGRLAREMDEAFVTALQGLSHRRFQFLAEMPAVVALERMLGDGETAAAWWGALWAEATPLWLYDDAGQPEESRGAARSGTAVCALGVERLAALLGVSDRADWRWLPTSDGRRIWLMRWRAGVLP